MGKKFIQDQEEYKKRKRLAKFMQEINPKPQGEERDKLLKKYMDARIKE